MDKDYFSTQSDAYRSFRPHYPTDLFQFLLTDLGARARVLDCATGNGQAATKLTTKDNMVIASDISLAQMSKAPEASGVHWVQASAERLPIPDNTIRLVTVAQALHWFEFDKFYPEVKRVLVPGGTIAAWTYSLLAICDQFGAEVANVIRWFYRDVVGEYWPPERRWVDDEYRSIPFPFEELETPTFEINLTWDRSALLGYVSSWSAVQLYRQATAQDPMVLLESTLSKAWPDASSVKNIAWPLSLRVGKYAGE